MDLFLHLGIEKNKNIKPSFVFKCVIQLHLQ